MKKSMILLVIILILSVGCAADTLQYAGEEEKCSNQVPDLSTEKYSENNDTIKVHICGEVYFPGVYTVYSGNRIYEVVLQAGGLTNEADIEAVNLVKVVYDGEQIYIPSVEEREESINNKGLVDLNKANEEVLCTLPGIGAERAKQIIDYREKNGNFKKIEDVMQVSGIKEGMFEKIAPYITVS